MDRRSLLGLIPAAAAVASFVSSPAAQAAPSRAPFPKILGGREPCTHTVISEMLDDVRSHVAANPGTVVLSADNPELMTLGFSVFSNRPDASEEERNGFLVRMSLPDAVRTQDGLDPVIRAKIGSQSGRMQIATALMGPSSEEEKTPGPTHTDPAKMFADIRRFVDLHPGATVLSADDPEILRVGFTAYVVSGEEKVLELFTISVLGFKGFSGPESKFGHMRSSEGKRMLCVDLMRGNA